MCRGTCWSQSEACQRCVLPSRRPPCSSWDNFEVAITVKLSSTSLPVMAKELRKNSIVERPFPTGLGWTSAFVALYPNFESLLEKGSSKIDLAWCWEMHLRDGSTSSKIDGWGMDLPHVSYIWLAEKCIWGMDLPQHSQRVLSGTWKDEASWPNKTLPQNCGDKDDCCWSWTTFNYFY